MKTKYWLLALVVSMLVSASVVMADSDFYVIAGGGGGVGTKISSLPYTISAPGFYYVTGNLTCTSGDGITVNADDVTLDLMGFRLLSDNGNGTGIYMNGRKNVEIRNGTLRNWFYGIFEAGGSIGNHRVLNVRVEGNANECILLFGSANLVKGCRVSGSKGSGIAVQCSTVSGNQVYNCDVGIDVNGGGTISNNVVVDCKTFGIFASGTVSGNFVRNSGIGIYLFSLGSVIGNTIFSNSGQVGIKFLDDPTSVILVDQNTVGGDDTHFSPGIAPYVKGTNAGF